MLKLQSASSATVAVILRTASAKSGENITCDFFGLQHRLRPALPMIDRPIYKSFFISKLLIHSI